LRVVTSLALTQVTALVDAHVNRDPSRFRQVTLQIAASVATRSAAAAEQLRKLVDREPIAAMTPLAYATGILSVPSTLATLDDMVLSQPIRTRLDRVVLEYGRRADLATRGLRPMRKLLFTGAPGVGKTMAAGALARAIDLPLFRVDLHGVIGSYLGETSGKLAKVFEHVRDVPAVYLFDEFDAIGAERASSDGSSAGAEMRRVVNSLLMFIEDDRSESLIVAATNHDQMLDGAIFRRFDELIAFTPLGMDELVALTDRSLHGFETVGIDFEEILAACPHLGHADLCAALERVRKDYVLEAMPIGTERLVAEIVARTRRTGGSA
jgi:SpoVK/Ycf46/Vps4 family AAA+-type ATPase